MTKSNKKRAGLQKKVSSVFNGVPIPGSKHKDRSDRMPSPKRSTASDIPKPGDNQTCQDPAITGLDQPAESVGRTAPAHFTASLPSMSTNHESSQSPEVGRIYRPEEVAERTVPDCVAATAPPTPTDSEGPQDPDAGKADIPEEVVKRTVPDYVSAPTPSTPTDSEDSRGPLFGNIFKSEESAGSTASERLAASPKPESAERQSSQSSLLKRMAECEETSREPEPVKARETSRKPAPVKTKHASHKPGPVGRPKSNPFAETSGSSLGQRLRDKLITSGLATGTAKDKVMAVLVPVLAIVMIFMFRQVLSKSPGKAKGATKDDAPVVVAANVGDEVEWKLPEPMPAAMRDPTKLPSPEEAQSETPENTQEPGRNVATSGTQTTAIRIRGLVYSQDKPSIVVGNEIFHIGDKVNGATIVRINRDSVEFERDGETWVRKVRD
jgi:hypothetical protein